MTSSTENATRAPAGLAGGPREVFLLAYPVVLTQISATALGVVDSAMVGRLGATELGAVGLSNIWLWTIFSLFYGTAHGVQTFVAQADGAGRREECGRWVWTGAVALAPAVLLTAIAIAANLDTLVGWLGSSSAMSDVTTTYLATRLPGEVGLALTMVLASFFRGLGDTRTPLFATLLANAVNAALDYGLIFGNWGLPAWGVAGAGIATACAHWLGAAALLVAFRRSPASRVQAARATWPTARETWRFVRTSAPVGGHWFVGMTAFAFFTTLVARMGDSSMAASQAFLMLLSLSFMQAAGLSIACSTVVGRYVGARDPEAATRGLRSSVGLGMAVAAIVAILFVAIPGPLLAIFSDDPSVLELGRPLLLLGALFQLFDALAMITEGALRGAGDTRWPFLVETALGWGLFVPLAWALAFPLGGGLVGAWYGALAFVCLLSAAFLWRFRSGAWKRIQI